MGERRSLAANVRAWCAILGALALGGMLPVRAHAISVGIYGMCDGAGRLDQVNPITAAGHTAWIVNDLTLAEFQTLGLDALMVDNCDNFAYGAEYLAHLADIETAVANGMVLILHDRYVDPAETILPGGALFDVRRDSFSGNGTDDQINVADGSTLITGGPAGTIDNATLDNGCSSNHGFTVAGTVPEDARFILTRDDPTELVTFAYGYGRGVVVYSTIPLDFYLNTGVTCGPAAAMRSIYAVNAVHYTATLVESACGNGAVTASEQCDLGVGNNGETCCAFDCQLRGSGDTCRPGDGCDPAEVCNGVSTTCPADVVSSAGTVCRAAADICDIAETCDGVSQSCPSDQVRPDGDSDSFCDLDDNCPIDSNPSQADQDGDGFGDVCDLDHFACYKARITPGSPPFAPINGVSLVDQFGAATVNVQKPSALCNPADKNGEDPTAPGHPEHLLAHQVKSPLGAPKFTKVTNLRVDNQFGTIVVDAVKRDRLLLPTAKSLVGPTPPLAAPRTDHFECYRVKTSKGQPKFVAIPNVSVTDQFGAMQVDVKKPTRLCNPVDKNGEDPSAPSHADHLMCYQIKAVKGAPRFTAVNAIYVNHQFGPQVIDATRPDELCVPSNKNAVCGNGVLEAHAGEECDDGNTASGDGCTPQCRVFVPVTVAEDLTTCSPRVVDRWTFNVNAGEVVEVRADTVDAATAADLCFSGSCGTQTFSADDNAACTFPPPTYSCPTTSFVATANSTCNVLVTVCSSACANAATANYELHVARTGVQPAPALTADDQLP